MPVPVLGAREVSRDVLGPSFRELRKLTADRRGLDQEADQLFRRCRFKYAALCQTADSKERQVNCKTRERGKRSLDPHLRPQSADSQKSRFKPRARGAHGRACVVVSSALYAGQERESFLGF